MKTEIIAGDTLEFDTTIADYPATDGWTLKFRLVPRTAGSGAVVNITATTATNGTDYTVEVAPAITAAYTAAEYTWFSWVEKVGARQQVEDGLVTIKPDPSTATANDGRSHARIVLDAIEAVLQGRATKDQEEYTIGDRSLKRTPLEELRKMRTDYRAEVRAEEDAERVANGLPARNKLQARL